MPITCKTQVIYKSFNNNEKEKFCVSEKLDHAVSKAKVLHRLTRKGIELLPVMVEIHLWAEKHSSLPDDRKKMLRAIHRDKTRFIEDSIKKLMV